MGTYPSCISSAQLCTKCYANQDHTCYSSYNVYGPSVCCEGLCNTSCLTKQTFCELGVQYFSDHMDVPQFQETCFVSNEFISKNWTASYWNHIIDRTTIAAALGLTQNQGWWGASKAVADPCNNTHPNDSLITAEKYNQIITMLNGFNQNFDKVSPGDVIKTAHAKALRDGSLNGTFNANVCDICNAGNEHRGPNCNCNCMCPCSCPCSDPCGRRG